MTDQEQEQSQSTDRPEWLPEKFENAEAMAASYSELEKKLSTRKPEPITTEAEAEAEDTSNDIDLQDFYDEYAEKGELSADSYARLKKSGLGAEQVDRFIKLESDAVAAESEAIFSKIDGGIEKYNAALEWASTNLEQSFADDFNSALDIGGRARDLMISDMISQYDAASTSTEPTGGSNLKVQTFNGPATTRFESQEQLMSAMTSAQYKADPAFRAEVDAKMLKSNF